MAEAIDANAPLASPKRIRAFVADVRGKLSPCEDAAEPDINVLSAIRAEEVTDTGASILWASEEPDTGYVEWGGRLPDLASRSTRTEHATTSHEVRVTGLAPGRRHVFRVVTGDLVSGDYEFRTLASPDPL